MHLRQALRRQRQPPEDEASQVAQLAAAVLRGCEASLEQLRSLAAGGRWRSLNPGHPGGPAAQLLNNCSDTTTALLEMLDAHASKRWALALRRSGGPGSPEQVLAALRAAAQAAALWQEDRAAPGANLLPVAFATYLGFCRWAGWHGALDADVPAP